MLKNLPKFKTTVIAEAGVNHNGDLQMALDLVDRAAEAGADYVKFQSFKATKLASDKAKKARYQVNPTDTEENQLNMLKMLELSEKHHQSLIDRCAKKGIRFLSSPFDLESLAILTEKFALSEIKVGSGEITNAPLLLAAGRSGAKIILSTGMSSLSEVEEALGVIAFGICRNTSPSSRSDFSHILLEKEVWSMLAERVTLLHCTSEYPAAVQDTNLLAMETLRRSFGVKVGYSDHTMGNAISLAAVALGASTIEKHFTLDRTLTGPDHRASLEPEELKQLISGIRSIELALGSGIKQPSSAEVANRSATRKSLIAACDLKEGSTLSVKNIDAKRSNEGISPMMLWDIDGTTLKKSLKKGDNL